eukprot:TRINITY_DN112131_c0_g1_i1.p1 TRINITY_DN112131_c0_g1~~TRINITY_DN112131_c0_g1_i1.p1  ORF type:complete len:138 (-),score=19.46 TRINITY_DN112131_c0_g1_i1:157-570(-)
MLSEERPLRLLCLHTSTSTCMRGAPQESAGGTYFRALVTPLSLIIWRLRLRIRPTQALQRTTAEFESWPAFVGPISSRHWGCNPTDKLDFFNEKDVEWKRDQNPKNGRFWWWHELSALAVFETPQQLSLPERAIPLA